MARIFLTHFFKSFFRSSSLGRDMTVQVMTGLVALMFIVYALLLGFALPMIITKALNQSDGPAFLNGLLLYYFAAEFVMRYLLQGFPALDALPYLHLPIARRKIVNFLLGKSFVHVLNLVVFLVFTPFALSAVAPSYGTDQACTWLLSLWLLSMVNHFLVILAKVTVAQSPLRLLAFVALCSLLAGADYYGWIRLSVVSEKLFAMALHGYAMAGVLLAAAAGLYYATYRTFVTRLYAEELTTKTGHTFRPADWRFLQRFGLTGTWLSVEVKLILRNRRPREVLLIYLLGMVALFIIHPSPQEKKEGVTLFWSIFLSGFFTMNYGQFLFNWQADHFDFTLTQPAPLRRFLEAKYWLLTFTTVLWFLVSLAFVFVGWRFVLVNTMASLYNVGINTFVVMNFSMWGAKRINLRRSGLFNHEGVGASQWMMSIPLMAAPYLFYLPFSLMGHPVAGLAAVGMAGVVGIVFRKKIIDYTTKRLISRRHRMASDFRKDF